MSDHSKKERHPWFLYSWLILIVALSLVVIIALPRIKQAFHESGMGPLIQEYVTKQESEKGLTTSSTRIAFPLPQDEKSFSYYFYPVSIQGTLPYHETIERLLEGPSYAALADGVVTFIPQGTRLRGLTISNKVAYVDFSKEFILPTVWETSFTLRTEQVKKTLMQEYKLLDVLILVEGELLFKEELSIVMLK